MQHFFIIYYFLANLTAVIDQKLAIKENAGVRTLQIESNKVDMQYSKIRSRLNKYF